MLRNLLIILTASLGILCLIVFVSMRADRPQETQQQAKAHYGTVQLLTAKLGELSVSSTGITAGNSKGELQRFTAITVNTKSEKYPISKNPISAPVLEHNSVYYVGDEAGVFHAYAPQSEHKWSYKTGNKIMGGAVFANGLILVGSYDQKLYAFDPDNGKLIYTVSCDSYINGTPVLSSTKDAVFLGSCDGMIRRINTHTGEITGQIELSSPIPTSPVLHDDILYAVTHNGTLVAIHSDTFEILYQRNDLGNFTSSPHVTDQYIFLTDTHGHITAYATADGKFISPVENKLEMTPLQAGKDNQYYAVSVKGKLIQYTMQNKQWLRTVLHDFQTDCQSSCRLFDETCLIADESGGLYFYEVSK